MPRTVDAVRAAFARNPDLGPRIVSGVALAAVAVVPVAVGGAALVALTAVAAGAMGWEFRRITAASGPGQGGDAPAFAAVPAVAVGLLAIAPVWVAVLVLLAGVVGHGVRDSRAGRPWPWAVAGLLVIGLACIAFPVLRAMPAFGLETVLWIAVVVVATDVGAYAVGRAVGGPKLWPSVSPKKTWAGLAGGVSAAVLAGAVFSGATRGTNVDLVCTVSAIAALVAQGGDLAESSLKRRFGVKDAGALIPGHGGVLDRLDGFLAATLAVAISTLIHGKPVFLS